MKKNTLVLLIILSTLFITSAQELSEKSINVLKGKKILYIERNQYLQDHHNTATMFQTCEINTSKFNGGSAMRIYDFDTKTITTVLESKDGVIRDPELSYDATKIIFSMRKNIQDDYHIYEIGIDGNGLRQLTFGNRISDIDPVYLPNGDIIFSASRQPKYCMCNRHIMCNLYRMHPDGSGMIQLGVNTLMDGHSTIMENGLVLYDRWEYVDRNFGDAQGLWTVNPDGTKHAIYYGNNTCTPGAIIDGRQIPGTDLVACTFSSCHDLPWGAVAILDRKKGVDGEAPVKWILPNEARDVVDRGHIDSYIGLKNMYEDPFPIDSCNLLVSETFFHNRAGNQPSSSLSGIFIVATDGRDELVLKGEKSLFDPMIIAPRKRPAMIPDMRDDSKNSGIFYVQNVYEGTHMKGVEPGSVKYIRVVETREKRTWTHGCWGGQGEQAPGVNWHDFEVKRIIGETTVNEDGSVCFEAPANLFFYFQLLDKDKKMIQSMRSGTMLMPGEINGCIGCHEDRLSAPLNASAMKIKPVKLTPWNGEKEPRNFSYKERVQPIFDKKCLKCHDFDSENRDKLVLAGDLNMFFNASYINLYVKNMIHEVGGGPASIQLPYTWGSHASKLTKVIDSEHHGVKLKKAEKEMLYTWMDINGVYYPTYETSFENLSGRSPLNKVETDSLIRLVNINFYGLNNHRRKMTAQISFDRPEKSPCLDGIKDDKESYNKAIEIIKIGKKRLEETPRGDIENNIVLLPALQDQLDNYMRVMKMRESE